MAIDLMGGERSMKNAVIRGVPYRRMSRIWG